MCCRRRCARSIAASAPPHPIAARERSCAGAPAQQITLEPVDPRVDAEHDRRGEDQPGEDASGVEHALRLRHDIADAAGRADILANDGTDEGEANAGMKAGEYPRHRGREIDM